VSGQICKEDAVDRRQFTLVIGHQRYHCHLLLPSIALMASGYKHFPSSNVQLLCCFYFQSINQSEL